MSTEHETGNVVVLDLGGTSLRLGHMRQGVACPDFQRISSDRLRVDNAQQVLVDIIREYATKLELKLDVVVLGLPGMIDRQQDTFTHCNNIPQLEGQGLQASLSAALQCRVILEQDIMLQLLGEWRGGSAQGSPAVFGVYFGTGIGAAYLVDGDPYAQSAAGLQAGHIPIMAQGKPCVCGNTDCIEAYACGHTLLELALKHSCSVENLFIEKDNPALSAELETFVLYQSFMIATLVTLFVPDMIVVGGGIPQMAGYPQDRLISNVRKHLRKPYPADSIKIQWACLGNHSTLQGALALLDLNDPIY
ncbi:ROK family protein [Granulosicoccus antarcticus]|uniref:D-allose kinase n=1 Tax=Granulosicoccus antarcticus IMCC3135 TaxID=1192854 RepID=A0A2Z2PAA8_9GAMM|nr:ROK family protein [Granulosicoccus antarcticus]ASJ76814.1 D-allose kinase [Granulosicoccus antarcticus IMCC3135]